MYGSKLKSLAKKYNLSQKELASISGSPESSISRWINAEYPPLQFIHSICNHVKLPLWQFFLDDPTEIAQHPVNRLHPQDVENLMQLYKLPIDLQTTVMRTARDLLQGLTDYFNKDKLGNTIKVAEEEKEYEAGV